MSDALRRLLARLDADPPRVESDDVATWPDGDFEALAAAGLLVEGERAAWADCDCDDGHRARVIWLHGDPPRAFLSCSELGRVEVEVPRLRRWTIDAAPLVRGVATALGAKAPIEALLPARLWHLGLTSTGGAPIDLFLARGLAWSDGADLTARLRAADHGPRVVLLAVGAVPSGLQPNGGVAVVPLDEIAVLDGTAVGVDRARLEALLPLGTGAGATAAATSLAKPSLDPEGWYTHITLAEAHGLDPDATRQKLNRLRKKDMTCFHAIHERSRNSPKYEYQYRRVRHVLVGRKPPERPPNVRRNDPRARPQPRTGG